METYTAVTNAVGGSLGLSALVATIPLLTFFVMLLGVKARAHWSALVALAASILVAVLGFHMPADLAGLSAVRGGIYGLVICWVILGAIWFYQLTVLSGRFEDLRRVFDASAAATCASRLSSSHSASAVCSRHWLASALPLQLPQP